MKLRYTSLFVVTGHNNAYRNSLAWLMVFHAVVSCIFRHKSSPDISSAAVLIRYSPLNPFIKTGFGAQ